MDFSAILERIYTVEQSRALIQALERCLMSEYRVNEEKKPLKELISHTLYPQVRPLFDRGGWKQSVRELIEAIQKMKVLTLYTPYSLTENSTEVVVDYVRDVVSKQILVSIVQKQSDTALAIEWNGTYGEF